MNKLICIFISAAGSLLPVISCHLCDSSEMIPDPIELYFPTIHLDDSGVTLIKTIRDLSTFLMT